MNHTDRERNRILNELEMVSHGANRRAYCWRRRILMLMLVSERSAS